MTKPEDDLPRFYIEAAQAVVLMHPFPSENETGKAIEAVRRAILSAVKEEREHLRKFLNVSPSDPYSLADLQTEQIKRLEGERA